jgi:hypothetical protein
MKLEGGCLCGSIRYRTESDPVMTVACQCHSCQRQTGTSFSVILAYKKGTLEFTKERPIFYEHKGGSGKLVRRHFCAKCGSPIMAELEATPELDWLKTGTLDDIAAPWLTPQVSIWGASAQSWMQWPEEVRQFAENAG